MIEPKIFIVILNFNSLENTRECLYSLQNVQYDNYEIVVVDNSEKEEQYKKLNDEFKNYKIIRAERNLGYANGNNIGIKYSIDNGADYICILNNDVVVEKDFLKPLVEELQKDDKVGIVGPCICEYNNNEIVQSAGAGISLFTGLTKRVYKGYSYKDIKKGNISVKFLGGACFMCKKEVIEKIGMIPENYFLFFEETEFCIKARKMGYNLKCIVKSKIYHKGSATISKFSGLSYYFLNRNRVVFIKRNSNLFQKIVFSIYVFIEALGRIILRREPIDLIKNLIFGFKANVNCVNMEEINKFIL